MRKTLMKLVAVVGLTSVVLALALPASAADKPDKAYTGYVVDVKDSVLTVRTVKNTEKPTKMFKVDDNTKCTGVDGAATTIADLKPGTKIEVTYTKQGEAMTATAVVVKAAAKKK